ncbi:TPA: lactate utilization protein [Candidatus Bathyarchaeota archaeon]|nr:lactate utilization protein [Candidatus Bathyarchaeota archaeon]
MKRAIGYFRKNVSEAFRAFPQTLNKRRLAKKIKEYSIKHLLELVKLTKDSVEEMKGNCYVANDKYDALRIIGEIVGNGKLVVKSKSITSEEIGLNEHLESLGNKVVETDLGEFILQRSRGKPMHILSPAIHIPKEKVAELFSKLVGRKLRSEIQDLVEVARGYLRDAFFKADVGISGANVIAAETGTIFLIENEGNIRFSTNAPRIHVVISGFEKIVPTLFDALTVSEVTWRYASYKVPSYISLISGPSKTGDIEKAITYGAHGPKELHVILLDNGRTKMAKDPVYREALYCVKCGSCLYECPIYSVVAGAFGDKYFGGIGAIWTALIAGGFRKAMPLAYSCTLCDRCRSHCPMEINVTKMIMRLRRDLAEKGIIVPQLPELCKNVHEFGNPFGLKEA